MSDIDDELFALAGGDEEAEEGEASDVAPSSPNSLGSGAMDESDSENDDSYHRDSGVPYSLEGKYIDEADKRRIESMSLLDRERVLGDRAEEMQRAKFNAELARRAKERESEVAQHEKKKRKAGSIEPEDSQRKSSRQKTKTSDKLEAYKREREQRGQLRQRQDDRRRRRHSSTDSRRHPSDVDADGESEVDWDEQARQAAAAREEALPPTLAHFEAVRANRAYFYKVCFYPGFEDAVVGAFARIGVGQDAQRRTIYKMAQIKEFSKGKPYTFDGPNGDKRATDQYLVVQQGSARKEYTFNYLSNSSFTENEFAAYKQSIAEANGRLPTRSQLDAKLADIRKMENRTWDDKAISEKLAKQNKYIHLVDREKAKQSANRPAHVDQTAQRLDEINRQNRKANSEQIRKALIEERRAELRSRRMKEKEFLRKKAEEEAKAKAQEEAAKAKLLQVPNSETDALFDGSDRSRSGTPAVRDGTPAKKEKRTGIPTFRKRKMDDDIISSLDLGIDIEI